MGRVTFGLADGDNVLGSEGLFQFECLTLVLLGVDLQQVSELTLGVSKSSSMWCASLMDLLLLLVPIRLTRVGAGHVTSELRAVLEHFVTQRAMVVAGLTLLLEVL